MKLLQNVAPFKLFAMAVLLSTAACSSHKAVPVGTIPAIQPPAGNVVQSTVLSVATTQAKQGRKLHTGCKYYTRTKQILDRLTDGIGAPRGTWPLYMVDGDIPPNASAVNQSVIVVHESFILRVRNDNDIATVLSHEVAHILAKHAPDKDQNKKVTAAKVGSTLLGVAATIGAAVAGVDAASSQSLGDLTATATGAVSAGLILQYDRDQEYEADQIGLMIMAKGGYDPRTAIDFWDHAEQIFGGGNNVSFFSTHPADSSRADRLQEALPVALKFYGEKAPAAQSARLAK